MLRATMKDSASRRDERLGVSLSLCPPLAQRSVLLRELCDISVLNEWSSDSPSDLFR